MTDTLLNREKEFHRLNREIDSRAKQLIKEIDLVVQAPSLIKNTNLPLSLPFQPRLPTALDDFYAEYPLHEEPDKAQVEPLENTSKDAQFSIKIHNSKNDALVKFLRGKIQMLLNELEKVKEENKKKIIHCKALETENLKISELRDKFYNQNNVLKDTIAKLEANIDELHTNLQEQNRENISLKKEIDTLRKEMKSITQQLNNLDLRLNRSLEENEKLRNSLKSSKIDDKELRSEMKKLKDNEKSIIRNLEKQKMEIIQSFKKQILLTDNLKKQKGLLEATKQIHVTQEDVTKLLNWKIKKLS